MSLESADIRILCVVSDHAVASRILEEVRKQFPRLKISHSVVDSAKRGISDFKEQRHNVVFFESSLPGLSASQFMLEILKLDGGVFLAQLGGGTEMTTTLGAKHFPLPIVNWREVVEYVQEAISDEVKVRLGLHRIDSAVASTLAKYAQRYRAVDDEGKSSVTLTSMISPPRVGGDQELAALEGRARKNAESGERLSVVALPTSFQIWDYFWIVATLAVCVASYWEPAVEKIPFLTTLQVPLLVILGSAVLALVVAKGIRGALR